MTGNLIQNYLNTHPRLEKAENTSVKNSNGKKSYLTYNNKIDTFNKTKPEAAQGHLINDTAADKLKYFVYDRKYDLKALKKGFNGTAKDHQLGRLNDVGLIIGGTAIATFIATGKQSPKLKIMEFLGFGAFLASMKLWPKLAIEIPAKLKHGFNVNKQYIDDQGRKKSVFQDPQYIPWDLYDQNKDDENFSKIGDKMGISKTIPNRDEVVKEQMRKVAVQNNTLWMLSSGFATPVMTALIASGCEGPLGNLLENIENSKTNKKITKILENLNNGSEISFDKTRFDKLNKILESNTGKVVDKNFVESVASTLSEGLDATTMDAIKKDLTSVLTPKNPTVTASSIEDVINSIKTTLTETMSKDKIETHFPKLDTIKEAIKEYFPNAIDGTHTLTNPSQADDFAAIIKDVINDSFVTKVSNKELDSIKNVVENTVTNSLKTTSSVLNNEQSKIISEFAKEILKFESTHEALEKCATLKVGRVENSLLARNWGEVEKTLIDVLGINSNELQAIKNSRISTEQLFAQKLEILAKPENEQAYKQALEKLTKTMEKFDLKLEGNAGTSSKMQELFDAFSTNYERTSSGISRITSSGKKVFENSNTVQRLLEERFAGAGSHKNMVIGDKLNRIDEVRFSYQRILKAFDIFKRAGEIDPSNKYELELAKKAKEIILNAHTKEFAEKFDTDNNINFYKKLYNWMFGAESTAHKATEEILSTTGEREVLNTTKSSFLKRFKEYSKKMFDIVGNDPSKIKGHLNVNSNIFTDLDRGIAEFTRAERTQERVFRLVGKTPSEWLSEASKNHFNKAKWLKTFSILGASVFGATLLTQLAFGKKDSTIKEVK